MAILIVDGWDGLPLRLHSVVENEGDEARANLLLGNAQGPSLVIVAVHNGRIASFNSGCGLGPDNIEQWSGGAPFLLPPPSYGPFVYVAGADTCLFVRAEPATEAAPLECIPEGAPLRDLEETATDETGREWLAVQTLSGLNGWAAAEFLTPGETR